MATIDKITAILNTEIKMPFKTKARESVHQGNPFKDSSFEKFTLPADIFQGCELKSQNRAKMIMSAIVGSVSNYSKRITESVSAFCDKVRTVSSSTWNYLRTTTISDFANSIGNKVSEKINSASEKLSSLKKNMELNKISENTPVCELESLWIKENELMEAMAA